LPFIALLQERLDVVELDARTDYRLEKLVRAPVYYNPSSPKADAALDAAFFALTGVRQGQPTQIELLGRFLGVPQALGGVARFDFDSLCRQPLGSSDYLEIAERFHTVFIDRIPGGGAGGAVRRRGGRGSVRVRPHGLSAVRDALGRLPRPAARARRVPVGRSRRHRGDVSRRSRGRPRATERALSRSRGRMCANTAMRGRRWSAWRRMPA